MTGTHPSPIMNTPLSKPGTGIKRLRHDIAGLPPRYCCKLDPEVPEHCTAEVEGVKVDIWLDDVFRYPVQHTASVFPSEDSHEKTPLSCPQFLSTLTLKGDISEMLLTISSVIASSRTSPTPAASDDDMTEVEYSQADDFEEDYFSDNDWTDNWENERPALLKENYNAVINSENELLTNVAFLDEALEGMIWIKIPIPDLIDASVFSQVEAETWGLSNDLSIWILFHIGKGQDDFKVYIRQAEYDAKPRDFI